MTIDLRVVIVGGGALGLATALHLVDAGSIAVVVIDRDHVASGSSGRSIGIVETQYFDAFDIGTRVFGRRFFDALEQEHQLRFTHNGYLRLALTAQEAGSLEASVEQQRLLGVRDVRVLGPGGIGRLVPDLALDDVEGAIFGPSDGYVDGYLYCQLLADLVRAGGGSIHQYVSLTGADRDANGTWRLTTSRGALEADVVVNAAGGWAGGVGEILGAPIPLLPQRHQAVTLQLRRPLGYVMPCVTDYFPGSAREGLSIRHESERQLLACIHTEEAILPAVDADEADPSVDDEFLQSLAELLQKRFPALEDAGVGAGWAGIYPMLGDGQPAVGPHPAERTVICALGAGGNGIQLSPAIGRLASEWIISGRPALVSEDSPWSSSRLTELTWLPRVTD